VTHFALAQAADGDAMKAGTAEQNWAGTELFHCSVERFEHLATELCAKVGDGVNR
jgi:hypothetical protein